jgi:hypothetical protein
MGLENVERWVEDVGKALKLTLIPSPDLMEKFYRRFHNCAGKLRKKGGRRREQFKAMMWTVPISSEDLDREVLVAELERAQEKIKELQTDTPSGEPSYLFTFPLECRLYTALQRSKETRANDGLRIPYK